MGKKGEEEEREEEGGREEEGESRVATTRVEAAGAKSLLEKRDIK